MPLLSLPLPRIPAGIVEYLPIRVPFPFMRIASILPHAINEPIKSSLMALFRLAWSAKLQIPVLITIVFMACDIRLQLEINIFWETNNARPHAVHGSNRNTSGQRRASREDMRRAALVAAALYQQQRRRLIQEMRAQQVRQHELARPQSLPVNAPLATEEDSDLEGSHDGDFSESDTLTYSHRSTTSEAGSFGSDEDETEDGEDNQVVVTKKKRKTKRSRPSSREPDEDDDEEDEDSTTDEDDNDDDDDENGGGMNGGSSSHGGGGGGGYRDDAYEDDDSDDMDDSSHGDAAGGYNSPLVLEIELRHRPLLHLPNSENVEACQIVAAQSVLNNNVVYFKNSNIYSLYFKQQCNLRERGKRSTCASSIALSQNMLLL